MNKQMIALNHMTKNYGKHRGVNDLSFSVNEGEVFGFIGPNGAGKSTTIRALMGLIRPTSGSASIFGMDCWKNASVIAQNVGYLPSEDSYYKNMKVQELLQYTADLYQKNCQDKMHELSERLDLDLSRRISELSLGNKKKVGIVSAFMTSPELIIMDEPTSGLDPLVQQAFYDMVREANRNGTTVFLSSHVLSEVQKLCGRVAILKDGGLVEIRSIRELRESGYKKVGVLSNAPIPRECFKIAGVTGYQENDERKSVSFFYNGKIPALIEKINELQPEDVFLEEPSLEEIFLHYYE